MCARSSAFEIFFQFPKDRSLFDRSLIEPLRPEEVRQQEGEGDGCFYMMKFAETILQKPLDEGVSLWYQYNTESH